MHSSRRSPGFTLIELLIAIVIIGILATVAISVFWRAKDRSLVTTLEADLRAVAAKQEEFFEASMTYATQEELLSGHSLSPGVVLDITYAQSDGWAGVAKHTSLPESLRCGLAMGDAPLDGENPATSRGRIMCASD
jgi:prepilin-type N-terminal cleavage/methylation domain-containing protein